MTARRELIIMAKAPALGHGKQRLAREAGAVTALRINRFLHRRTLRAALGGPWTVTLWAAPRTAVGRALPGVWPSLEAVARRAQPPGDLGARIAAALARVQDPVCVIGTDAPGMTAADIAAAFKALGRCPAVIGPAADGGFWLVGARRGRDLIRALAGVRWSTPHAGADMAAGLPGPIARLRTLRDIDDLAAWRDYRSIGT